MIFCTKCNGETDQDILYTHREPTVVEFADNELNVEYTACYEIIRCKGCHNIDMRKTLWSEGDADIHSVKFDDHMSVKKIERPAWLNEKQYFTEDNEEKIRRLLQEVLRAAQFELYNLALLGIRSALEQLMISKAGDQGNFAKNVEAFRAAGHITTNEVDTLNKLLDVGHAVAHRGYAAVADDFIKCWDVLLSLVARVVVDPRRITAVHVRIPPRPPRRGV